jgi:predicted NBD/HSP70 family sugar kinase
MLRRRPLLNDHRLTERGQKSLDLLEIIRQRGQLTRTELSQATGFNIVTVSNYIGEFIKQGLVVERGFDISTGGRKPILVELSAKSGFAIGVDLGPMDMYKSRHSVAVMTDLRGQIVHQIVKPRTTDNFDHVLQGAGELIREILDTSPVDIKKIQGIGIGLPGILDEHAGTIRETARGGVRVSYVSVRDAWESEFKLPVLLGNDATLAGYGELRFGLDRPVNNLVYLYSYVGASLVFDGHIYWGSGGSAGEMDLCVASDDDYLAWVNPSSSPFTLLKYWDLGLTAQARKLVEEGHDTLIKERVYGNLDAITMDTVIQAAQAGDQLSKELIEHSALQLGIRIASLVNLLNPEVVVIGGGIEKAGSLLLEPVWRAVKRYAYEEPASLVDVLPAKLGEQAVALGAACWVIREIFIQA